MCLDRWERYGMKKKLKILSAVFLYIGLLWFFIPQQLPELESVIPKTEMLLNGNVLLAENQDKKYIIYEIDMQGVVQKAYSHKRGKFLITDISYDDEVYFLGYRESMDEKQYEIYKIAEGWKHAEKVCGLTRESSYFLTDFLAKDGILYFTGIDKAEDIVSVDKYDVEQDNPSFETVESGQIQSGYPVMAAYTGDTLYALSDEGRSYYFLEGLCRTFEEDTVSWMTENKGGILYHNLDEQQTCYSKIVHSQPAALTDYGDAQSVSMADSGNAAVLYGGSPRELVLTEDGQERRLTELKTCAAVKIELVGKLCIILTLFYLLAAGLFMFIQYILRRQRTIALKLIGVVTIFVAAFVIILTAYIYWSDTYSREAGRIMSTKVYAEDKILRLEEKINLEDIIPDKFVNTEYFDIVRSTLSSWLITDEEGNDIIFSVSLVYRDGGDAYILQSVDYAYGKKLSSIYDADIVDNLVTMDENTIYSRGISGEGGVRNVYIIYPADNSMFFIAKGGINGLDEQNKEIFFGSLRISCVYGLFMIIILFMILYMMLHPIRRLSLTMEKVADGNYDLPEIMFPDNELGDMWIYLHKMCKALKIQHYSKTNVLNYFYRFAPKRFEVLFDKEKLQEVAIGDTAAIQGTMGIISVAQKGQFLKSRMPGKYIRHVNQLLDIISTQKARGDGVLLSNDSNLESIKVIYKEGRESVDTALRFAVESINALEYRENAEIEITPFAILHTSRFLCGLAGTGEQSYPFATSLEMEKLNGYIEQFKEIGLKLVITENTKKHLCENFEMRYIGYLKSGNEGMDFAVYEVLEVYRQQEKYGKQKADEKFQEALRLFYDSDFYLARSCFMEVLKICPEDGVARWYLFRCEEMFHTKGGQGVFHLF